MSYIANAAYLLKERMQNAIKLSLLSDSFVIKSQYKSKFGRVLRLDPPQSFSEKLQWRKLHERDPLFVQCSDKYAVREYVRSKVGADPLIPLIQVVSAAKDIRWDGLPAKFAIRATHGCGWNLIVEDKSRLDTRKASATLARWLMKNYYPRKREWQYGSIKPRLVIEELLQDDSGHIPADYKLHVFNQPSRTEIFIQVDSDRFGDHRRDFFDERWRRLDLAVQWPHSDSKIEEPVNLAAMLDLARRLASEFRYVRVDLYSCGGSVYFGELTFSPGAGLERFFPEAVDYEWGSKFQLSLECG